MERVFASSSSARKTAITTCAAAAYSAPLRFSLLVSRRRVLQLVLELCSKRIHVTKRDLFYTDVKLFKQQARAGGGRVCF